MQTNAPSLLDMALDLQKEKGWISDSDVADLAKKRGLPASQVYEALSFYSMIQLEQPVKVLVQVCRGTSCYTAKGGDLLQEIQRITQCSVGQTSLDGVYRVDYVECIGHCETAPNVLVNGKLYQSVTPESIQTILKEAAL
ncbi:MAG: NAD(P)H-dependent oxidoreductase subunit E [Acutalibacter sp.]